ncbi:hypothetical protein [Rhodococcus jostii]|uniref:hypothetical protein n=1 Tax=Rhodococcus jostii TaxID=132919 RepID=UPI00362B3A91
MQSDIAATTSGKSLVIKEAVLDEGVTGFRKVAAQDRPDRPDWLTPLMVGMDTQKEAAADGIADYGRCLPRLFDSREWSLLVLVDLVLFDPWPAKASWHAATRRTALDALVDDFPHLDLADLDWMREAHKLRLAVAVANDRQTRGRAVAQDWETLAAELVVSLRISGAFCIVAAWLQRRCLSVTNSGRS